MPNYATLRKTVEEYIEDNTSDIDIEWSNVDFNPPDNEMWLRVQIRPTSASAATMGSSGSNRIEGIVLLSLFIPKNSGAGATLLDTLSGLFNRKNVGLITFFTPEPDESEGDQHYIMRLSCPFMYYDYLSE